MIQFEGAGNSILTYLHNLSANNQKEWFDQNKKDYDLILKDFKRVVFELAHEITKFDNTLLVGKPEDYIYRIYKDQRFSKDKTPYKTHFAAYICNGGKKSPRAGYYLHIEPGNCFIAGGLYRPSSVLLKGFRQEIYFSQHEFLQIVENKEFKTKLDGLMDDKLIKFPKDFPSDLAVSEYFKYKSVIASKKFQEEDVLKVDFFEKVLDSFKALKPLTIFINKSIDLTLNNE